jgi:hypothetical protein
MTLTLRFFHNTKVIWDEEDGFSLRFGFNYGDKAISLYIMLGSTEHWYGLGWW